MLFFYFIAALLDATGWMVAWAALGMVFSNRPFYLFIVPMAAALLGNPDLGVIVALLTWVWIFFTNSPAASEEDARQPKSPARAGASGQLR